MNLFLIIIYIICALMNYIIWLQLDVINIQRHLQVVIFLFHITQTKFFNLI